MSLVLDCTTAKLLFQTRRDNTKDFYDVWLFQADVLITALKLQATEVINAQWVNRDQLLDMFKRKELHPLINYIVTIF